MKYGLFLVAVFMCCVTTWGGALSEDELERLERHVKIDLVSDSVVRDDDRNKLFLVKCFTIQEEDSEYDYRFRVTVEFSDKDKNRYFAQVMAKQSRLDEEYIGEDAWEFRMLQGEDLERPKITAYAVQYGILYEGEFIPLSEKFDDVDTLEELTERSATPFGQKARLRHQFRYHESPDESSEILWSYWRTVE